MMANEEKIVFVDLETGGLDPLRHPIIQIALIAVTGSWEECEAAELKIRFDETACDPGALVANHYDAERWKVEAVSPSIARASVADFFRRHATLAKVSKSQKPYTVARLAAHNAPFDCGFVAQWYRSAETFCPAACFEPLDTLALARWASLGQPNAPRDHKLGSLCEWLGIPHAGAHDALADVRATVQVAKILAQRMGVGSDVPR